jgi:methyl-accepting chemotaxis protein
MNWTAALVPMPHERRFVRFSAPRQQLRLATAVFALTLGFAALIGLNSYAAYGRLTEAMFAVLPVAFREDVVYQTTQYATITIELLLAYALALIVLCGAYVNRLTGPAVALERHVRALRSGDYRSRVRLRGGGDLHAGLARQLNELAEQLEEATTERF